MEFTPRIGYVLLRELPKQKKGLKKFGEKTFEQPRLAEIVSFSKPNKEAMFEWDDKIQVGAVVLMPVTKKQEFADGIGSKLAIVYHADLKIWFKEAPSIVLDFENMTEEEIKDTINELREVYRKNPGIIK